MLTEIYVEALLLDEELADRVWEAWDVGFIPDDLAAIAWWLVLAVWPGKGGDESSKLYCSRIPH